MLLLLICPPCISCHHLLSAPRLPTRVPRISSPAPLQPPATPPLRLSASPKPAGLPPFLPSPAPAITCTPVPTSSPCTSLCHLSPIAHTGSSISAPQPLIFTLQARHSALHWLISQLHTIKPPHRLLSLLRQFELHPAPVLASSSQPCTQHRSNLLERPLQHRRCHICGQVLHHHHPV